MAGLADLVEIRTGDALETLAADLPEVIDLVLLDGAKRLYPKVLSLLEPRLRPGALVVADNADLVAQLALVHSLTVLAAEKYAPPDVPTPASRRPLTGYRSIDADPFGPK